MLSQSGLLRLYTCSQRIRFRIFVEVGNGLVVGAKAQSPSGNIAGQAAYELLRELTTGTVKVEPLRFPGLAKEGMNGPRAGSASSPEVATAWSVRAMAPAMPCMASRLAYGEEVTREKLSQVEQAEDFLYDLGLRILRVRHHGDIARIEVPPEEFERLIKKRMEINKRFHDLGFLYVSLDLGGFKSGSLNAVL